MALDVVEAVKKSTFLKEDVRLCLDLLLESVGHEMLVLPNVKIADIFEADTPRTDQEFWAKFDQIAQKHINFLLCKREDAVPLVALQISGGSSDEHLENDEAELLQKTLTHSNIVLLVLSFEEMRTFKEDFDTESLRFKIVENLKDFE